MPPSPPTPEPPAPVAALEQAPEPETPDVPRIAPEAAPVPPEEVTPQEAPQPAISDTEDAETPAPEQDVSVAEAAIERSVEVPEDVQAPRAPDVSQRPQSRPANLGQTQPPVDEPAEDPADREDAVAAALAEALGGASEPEAQASSPTPIQAPTGPRMTAQEMDALRVAVASCWNVGSLSSEALQTTVVVGMTLNQSARPDTNSIRLISSSGGQSAAAKQAFEAARRAIIRCGASGFDLPAEKYAQWRDIEMTFNPEGMRIR